MAAILLSLVDVQVAVQQQQRCAGVARLPGCHSCTYQQSELLAHSNQFQTLKHTRCVVRDEITRGLLINVQALLCTLVSACRAATPA